MHARGWITFTLAAGAAAATACSGGDAAPDAFPSLERCDPGGSFTLDGARAAVLGVLNVHVNASGLVEVDTTAELLVALDIQQDGTLVAVSAEACAIQIPDVPIEGQERPIHFEVRPETISSVGRVEGTGTLSSPSETCATFQTSELVLLIGAKLEEGAEATGTLPQADGDGVYPACLPTADTTCDLAFGTSCACDQEGDGKPGATLYASNVPAVNLDEVYVALRTKFQLRGQVHSSELVLGQIVATLEQGILGCHLASGNDCAAGEVRAVKVLNPVITQQPNNPSRFRAVRVDPSTSCAEIVERRNELFPR